jgi:hypothetical protein
MRSAFCGQAHKVLEKQRFPSETSLFESINSHMTTFSFKENEALVRGMEEHRRDRSTNKMKRRFLQVIPKITAIGDRVGSLQIQDLLVDEPAMRLGEGELAPISAQNHLWPSTNPSKVAPESKKARDVLKTNCN